MIAPMIVTFEPRCRWNIHVSFRCRRSRVCWNSLLVEKYLERFSAITKREMLINRSGNTILVRAFHHTLPISRACLARMLLPLPPRQLALSSLPPLPIPRIPIWFGCSFIDLHGNLRQIDHAVTANQAEIDWPTRELTLED